MTKAYRPPDPRCIFALAAYFSLFAVIVRDLRFMIALLALTALTAVIIGVNLRRTAEQLKQLWQIVLIVALLQSLFSPSGKVWLSVGPVALLTSGGAETGIIVLGRLTVLILSGSLFTLYPSGTLIQGLIQMKLPYEVAYMVSVGLRFVPMMREEFRDSLTALALRGVEVSQLTFRRRMNVYIYLLLPMVAGSLQRAGELALSMEMRGFGANPVRTSYSGLCMGSRDYIWLATTALLAVLTCTAILFTK